MGGRAQQSELSEDAARADGGTQRDLPEAEAGNEGLHAVDGFLIAAGPQVEEGEIVSQPLEVGDQLITGGEPWCFARQTGARETTYTSQVAVDTTDRRRRGRRRLGSRCACGHRLRIRSSELRHIGHA